SSFRGRPRFPVLSGGSTAFTRSHCSFVNSYRFMSLFYTSLSFVQFLFFKQGLAKVYRRSDLPSGRKEKTAAGQTFIMPKNLLFAVVLIPKPPLFISKTGGK
ncbi:MAG: hypothetical protein HFF81_09225, partial [Oscillospiraceae bacterium]|nr:hypothetical protein [Oscillospiraceae bacterium]